MRKKNGGMQMNSLILWGPCLVFQEKNLMVKECTMTAGLCFLNGHCSWLVSAWMSCTWHLSSLTRRMHLSEPQRVSRNHLSYFFHSSAFLLHISLAGPRMHSLHCLLTRKCFCVSCLVQQYILCPRENKLEKQEIWPDARIKVEY